MLHCLSLDWASLWCQPAGSVSNGKHVEEEDWVNGGIIKVGVQAEVSTESRPDAPMEVGDKCLGRYDAGMGCLHCSMDISTEFMCW